MRTSILCGLVVVSSSFLCAADQIQPLDVKLGLWETTFATNQMSGMPSIPPEAMANLPPEQRAKIEEAMKARGAANARRTCITKDKLDKTNAFSDERKTCTRTVVTSTSHKLEMRVECGDQASKVTGTVRIEAVDSENIKGTTQMAGGTSDHPMNVNGSFTAKWIGSDCGTVK